MGECLLLLCLFPACVLVWAIVAMLHAAVVYYAYTPRSVCVICHDEIVAAPACTRCQTRMHIRCQRRYEFEMKRREKAPLCPVCGAELHPCGLSAADADRHHVHQHHGPQEVHVLHR